MNVYDFDNTIYSGESVFDFYIFCLKRHPLLVRYIFTVLFSWAKYKLLLLSREQLMLIAEKYAVKFFDEVKNVQELVKSFWDKNQKKIKAFYLASQKEDDVVVSASVGFLLEEICRRIGISRCICTQVDIPTGRLETLCFRQNKPGLFAEAFPDAHIENFFSDSMNDIPMMRIADNAFLVKGEKIIPVSPERLLP